MTNYILFLCTYTYLHGVGGKKLQLNHLHLHGTSYSQMKLVAFNSTKKLNDNSTVESLREVFGRTYYYFNFIRRKEKILYIFIRFSVSINKSHAYV